MQKFFKSKLTFSVFLALFLATFAWNSSQSVMRESGSFEQLSAAPTHGPSLPPDPWDVRMAMAHGPSLPPDPWDATHGPSLPPDPWDATHGPSLPPDPWDVRIAMAHGPSLPPDPWDLRVTA
jgi:hypothetical protein